MDLQYKNMVQSKLAKISKSEKSSKIKGTGIFLQRKLWIGNVFTAS